ncbi:formate dehydrogenase accessory protein FdhE [Bacillus rubiinfantis]|uniref:formate dehydrogenase accessory protein FdhE n=1 Tax=Bacillus rubiinfantis TaxID=1499680 RepID=UPI0005A9222A|nr:formate dehydrogenase accessory protein FdhE [Bacillus rubiinfantis]
MMKSVVSTQYQNLQKELISLQEQWKQKIGPETIKPELDQAAMSAGVPIAAMTIFHFNIPLFQQCVNKIVKTLIGSNPELEAKLLNIDNLLDEATAQRWLKEAVALNQPYFATFADEHQLEQWIPSFLAEMALRPYLLRLAEMVQEEIHHGVPTAGCPVCGEPARLAALEEDGKKVHHCPRCQAHWQSKRLECSHCSNTDHNKLDFITIEGDATGQIEVCEECHGYTKIIDTRQYIVKPSAALLDLQSIHLDFVAQEQGYTAVGVKADSANQ